MSPITVASSTKTAPASPPKISESALPQWLAPTRQRAWMVGGAGTLLALVLAFAMPRVFLPAYLSAYAFVLGISVGSLAILLLHHLVGGQWGFLIRRPLEAATMTLPWMALLFLPIAAGARGFYDWADPEIVANSAALTFKHGYLNLPFWLFRAALYLGLWNAIALLVQRNSRMQDNTEDPAPTRRNQTIAAPGLIVLFVTVTFATIDWMMSIEPTWYSSIYGVMILVGWVLSALTAMTIVSSWLSTRGLLQEVALPVGFHDLGNLTLAFVMLWAYMSFSQYLIIWSGNIAEELPWYLSRSDGLWRYICIILMVFHFFVPFFLLLVRENKRESSRLWKIGAFVLVMQLVNTVWLIVPAYKNYQWVQVLLVAPALAAVAGVWVWSFTGNLTSRPLVPRHDPLLQEAIEHHGHGGGGH